MKIDVRFFAISRDLAGVDRLTLDLPADSCVGDARAALISRIPALADLIQRSAFAINQSYARPDDGLSDRDELAIIPPVSGG